MSKTSSDFIGETSPLPTLLPPNLLQAHKCF